MKSAAELDATFALATNRCMIVDSTVQELHDELNPSGGVLRPEIMVQQIPSGHGGGSTTAINNGLSDEKNREPFHTIHPPRMAELVLMRLSRLLTRRHRGIHNEMERLARELGHDEHHPEHRIRRC